MGIGELGEGPLHAALKRELAGPEDRLEVPLGRWVIDLVRADGELVEIQTGTFAALGPKLDDLLDRYRMRIVFPVPGVRRIVRIDGGGEVLSERLSPKAGRAVDVFDRLVSLPTLIEHPNLALEVVVCREDHVRGVEPVRTRRGRMRDPGVRHLVGIESRVVVSDAPGLLKLLPAQLPQGEFTTAQLAFAYSVTRPLAAKIAYCLHLAELVEPAGRAGRSPLWRRAPQG